MRLSMSCSVKSFTHLLQRRLMRRRQFIINQYRYHIQFSAACLWAAMPPLEFSRGSEWVEFNGDIFQFVSETGLIPLFALVTHLGLHWWTIYLGYQMENLICTNHINCQFKLLSVFPFRSRECYRISMLTPLTPTTRQTPRAWLWTKFRKK